MNRLASSGPSRLVGLDYGLRRVGLSLADPLRLFAQPWQTLPPKEAVAALVDLHAREGIDTVVVGWPLTPEGEEGDMVRKVRPFMGRLKGVLPGVELVAWDERFSSERAKAAIKAAGAKRGARRDKSRVDAAAAAVLLQEYLDERS